MTDQILPNEILREIVHNCPQDDRLALALTFRGANKSFGDILNMSVSHRNHSNLYYVCTVSTVIGIDSYVVNVNDDNLIIGCGYQPVMILLTRRTAGIYDIRGDPYISNFHHGNFTIHYPIEAFRKYISEYDHAADKYPDRKHPMDLAQKMFWKTCKYYIPPVIVQFIYDNVQLMERQLRGH